MEESFVFKFNYDQAHHTEFCSFRHCSWSLATSLLFLLLITKALCWAPSLPRTLTGFPPKVGSHSPAGWLIPHTHTYEEVELQPMNESGKKMLPNMPYLFNKYQSHSYVFSIVDLFILHWPWWVTCHTHYSSQSCENCLVNCKLFIRWLHHPLLINYQNSTNTRDLLLLNLLSSLS